MTASKPATKNNSDFSQGSIPRIIIRQSIPLMVAQIAQLLYNIVDRIYIGHLPTVGSLALTGLGVTFPIIMIISAFTNLFGTGGSPLFSMARGKKNDDEAETYLANTTMLLTLFAAIIFVVCMLFRRPMLYAFGADHSVIGYADDYLFIYLFGTVFSMLATGLTPFITAEGFPKTGMATTVIGAALNCVLDPVFIFGFHMGVRGAAIATVISQIVSAMWVLHFLTHDKAVVRLKKSALRLESDKVKRIFSLGMAGFIMVITNAIVQIACNKTLAIYGGTLYIGVMTVVSSIRQIVELPSLGIVSGATPVLSYNYGAEKNDRVRAGIRFMFLFTLIFNVAMWLFITIFPHFLMGLFTNSDKMIAVGTKALHLYFMGFFFMSFQYTGQTTFTALGHSKSAIFFSLLRKVIIVVPLTILLPHIWSPAYDGVFAAEPISNVVGGLASFTTMMLTVYRKLGDDNKH